jgi:potassium efflux system protein
MVRRRRTLRRARAIDGLILAMVATLTGAATGQVTPTPGVVPPTAIPVSAIAAQVEEARTELRSIEKHLAPDPAVQAITANLPKVVADLDALQASIDKLKKAAVGEGLDDVAVRAKALKGTLAAGLAVLTGAAARLDDDLVTLAGMRQVWKATAAGLQAAAAPPVVAQRLAALLDEIGNLQRLVEGQRAERLVVQDKLTRQGARADEILEQVSLLRTASAARLFNRSDEPVWRARGEVAALGELPAMVRAAVARNFGLLQDFAYNRPERLWLSGVIYAALVLLLWRGRRGIAQLVEHEPALAHVRAVVERPFASAFVGCIVLLRFVNPDAPQILPDMFGLVAIVALVRVGSRVLDHRLLPATYVVLGLVGLQMLRDLLGITPLQRLFLFFELPLAIVLFVVLLRRLRRAAAVPTDVHGAEFRAAVLLLDGLLGVCGLSLAATMLGYVTFGRFLTERALLVAALAVALLVAYRVLQGVVAIVLRGRRLNRLYMVRRHSPSIERRCARVLTVALVLFWLWRGLILFGLDAAFFRVLTALLGATFTYRAFAVSLSDVLAVSLVIWASFRLSAFVRFVLEEDVFPRMWLQQGKAYALSTLLHYTIVTLGFLVALAFLGFNLDRFAVIAGAFGVGIGFGMQAIVNNFVSGLILLFERPLRVNDRVQIGEVTGEIKRIGFRSSTVRTFEGAELIVPNSILVSETVTNWTLSDRLRRIDIQVGVAYGTDVRQVLGLLLEVARQHPHVIDDPAPVSLFLGFGDSSLNFELRAWTERVEDWIQIRSELTVGTSEALGAAGIEIPFPQRDVHLTSRAPVDVRVVDPNTSGRS